MSKHPQDDGKPYVCQDTPDLFAPRIKRKRAQSAASQRGWRTKKRIDSVLGRGLGFVQADILAAIKEGPPQVNYGDAIASRVGRGTNPAQVYVALRRLADSRLIVPVPNAGVVLYQLTDAGHLALNRGKVRWKRRN